MSQPHHWESLADKRIREAMERGEFDNLPGAGRPLELSDDPDWWIKSKLRRENLEPVLPTALSLRRQVERVQETLADVPTEAEARGVLEDLNERIRTYYASQTERSPVVVRLVDVDAELRLWADGRP